MSDLPKIGIDIGSTSIKLVELMPNGHNKWKLLSAATMGSPKGGVMGNQNNLASVTAAVVKILKEASVKSKRVVVALPEEQVSSHVVEMPLMNDDEIRQALQWQVEQYIPIPADKAVWSYEVIKKDQAGGGMEVLLVAAAKSLVASYTQVLEQAGLEVVALETELMASTRSEVPDNYPLSMLVDIGSRSTDLGVVRNSQLVFTRTIPTAGDAFSRAIESGLGLDSVQAEQYKNTYGFIQGRLDGKLVAVMTPVLNIIGAEIKKTIDFYTSKHAGETLKVITLSGGVSLLPEVVGLISGLVGVEVSVGNPFAKVSLDQKQSKSLLGSAPFYGVATGLAMRTI